MKPPPSQVKALIIGGGVIGCSLAYHLAKLGWKDVLLLERRQIACGTTWHAAGLIAQLRPSRNMTRLAKYTQELYAGLREETGIDTGFRHSGSITLALTSERLEELYRLAAMARAFDVEVAELSPADIKERYPHLNVDDATGGVYLPKDGQGDPANIAQALAKGARSFGANIIEHVKVTSIARRNARVAGATWERRTDDGEVETGSVEAEFVVNCAGMWGRDIGAMAGVNVPLQACEHFYIVTEAIDGLGALPVLRVPDECAYYKEDAGKILLGAFEPNAKPWAMDGIPEDFCFDQLPEDFDHFEPILDKAVRRMPVLAQAGIHTFFNGPESFTPDDKYLLGESPELRNFFVAAGFNSIGIQSAGGAGCALAQWMDEGLPPFDLWDVDIRRMMPFQNNKNYLVDRVSETLGLLYDDHFPYRQFESARGVRRSPIHAQLETKGACFGEVAGWERANWFAPAGVRPEYQYSWKRQNWFEYAREEHLAVRGNVGMFDMSSFGKIRVEGSDSEDVLQRLCANDVKVDIGKIVYTQWLNERGGIEADVTVTRLAGDSFLVVTPAATIVRDFAHLKHNIPENANCVAVDVSAMEATLVVMGPKAREFLAPLTNADLSNEAFAFGTAQRIDIGMACARAHRISYVGELGWELYVSADMAAYVFEQIDKRAKETSLRYCGLHVLDSCRLEKGFRHYGHDITDEDHILEAGLGFAVKKDKERSKFGDFFGRDAVLALGEKGLSRRLVQFRLRDPEPLLYHNEPILRDDEIVGYITSGNYGHYLGGATALGYVPCERGESAKRMLESKYSIEVAGIRVDADASIKPLYDPHAEKMNF